MRLRLKPVLLLTMAGVGPSATEAADDATGQRAAVELDMFRAMQASDLGETTLENFDLASLGGVLKYVHTEVVAEHLIGDPERPARKNGIDVISRFPVRVRNPGLVLGRSSNLATFVDFGPFVTFDNGVATNLHTQRWISEYGGYVGVQQQRDPRWPFADPYYWFSVTGWCPNIRYDRKATTRQRIEQIVAQRESLCARLESRMACRLHPGECVFEQGACAPTDPMPECLNSTTSSGRSGHVLGGLCPGGAGSLVEPTGDPGCTYSYGKAELVSLDRLAGILDEDCGGRQCQSWLDFRHNCSNAAYRYKFSYATQKPVPFKYCVEYDVAPACEADCSTARCQALPADARELGLLFWQGRCSAAANQGRVAMLEWRTQPGLVEQHQMDQMGSPAQHHNHRQDGTPSTCVHEVPGSCAPALGQGGNYCTRYWDGVCTNCFVPGTVLHWPAGGSMPYCPYDVLRLPDYKDFRAPHCNSTRPSDLCCLYTGTCSLRASSELEAPLNEDGFALVASWSNATATAAFLARAAKSRGYKVEVVALRRFVLERWGGSPRQGEGLQEALALMQQAPPL